MTPADLITGIVTRRGRDPGAVPEGLAEAVARRELRRKSAPGFAAVSRRRSRPSRPVAEAAEPRRAAAPRRGRVLMATIAIGRRPGRDRPPDDGSRRCSLVPRAGPAVRGLRDLRPRGARVRAHALGRRVRRRRAHRGRAGVHRPDPAAAVRPGPARRHQRGAPRRHPPARRVHRRSHDDAPRRRGPLPRRSRAADGPDVGRSGAVPAVSGHGPAAPARRDRGAQPALPARFRLVAAVRARSPTASTTGCASTASSCRGRHARRQPLGPSRGRRQRPDPSRLSWPRLRDRRRPAP